MRQLTNAIFLSYASQDAAAARRICDALRTAGHEIWFDQSELRGGDAWDAPIRKQVKECALFIPLISTNTDARSEGYFRREWNLAVQRKPDMAGAKELNPNYPGWYWYAAFYDSYRQRGYRSALSVALKVKLLVHWFMHATISAAYGQLGDLVGASKAIQDLLKVRPGFTGIVRKHIERWWDREYTERLIDGWRKAGLEITPANPTLTQP